MNISLRPAQRGLLATFMALAIATALPEKSSGASMEPASPGGARWAIEVEGQGTIVVLPDLRTLPPDDLRLVVDRGAGRSFLRFTNFILNSGAGPLELIGDPDPASGMIRVRQRIYDNHGQLLLEPWVGEFVYHGQHRHWHLDDFARYEVWSLDLDGELRQLESSNGKVSYCLMDVEYLPGAERPISERPQFLTCLPKRQGLSVNWVDTYEWTLPRQWVELTGLSDGVYALRSVVDHANLIRETDDENNAAIVYFEVRQGRMTLVEDPAAPFQIRQWLERIEDIH